VLKSTSGPSIEAEVSVDQDRDTAGVPESGLSRRGVLAGALTGGLAALVPLAPAAARAANTSAPGNAIDFFADPELNFQALFALGAASYNASQPGEVLEAFDRVHAEGDTYRAYHDELLSLGRRTRQLADNAARAGRRVTARDTYLRAATYLDQALFFVLASARPTRAQEGLVYREMESAFAGAAALFDPAFERVSIPYGRGSLPGWLLSPAGTRVRRPTIILNNGSDAQNLDLFVAGGAAAIERGWNALIFEGPGQGSNLFLHNIPFRPDWEKVISPIVSWLRARPDVDKRRITLFGSSFGGYLVPRAAAFEHRLAGVAVDPGVHNAFVSWEQNLPPQMLKWLREGRRREFDSYWAQAQPYLPPAARFSIAKRSEIYGNVSFYDRMRLASKFVLPRATARRVDAPTIITQAQDETFFPGQSRTLYDWVRVKKTLARFTAAEGAQFHCEPMAPTVRNDTVLDWLEANLRPTR
jgi:Alpha/beta hydrolase family